MAFLWYTDRSRTGWQNLPVPDDTRYTLLHCLSGGTVPRLASRQRLRTPRSEVEPLARLMLVRVGDARSERWYGIVYPGVTVRVNGRAVATGLVGLSDRDLVGFGPAGPDWVFTTERMAAVESFAGPAGSYCPRCKQPLQRGQQVVICPACRCVHHQDEAAELPCWEYAPVCSQCDHATDLNRTAFSWTPDEI